MLTTVMTTSYPYGYRRQMSRSPILRLCLSQEDRADVREEEDGSPQESRPGLESRNLNIKNKEEVMDGKIKRENEGFMENPSHQFP